MSPPDAEVPYGTLDLMVLTTLDSMGALHGYGIIKRAEELSDGRVRLAAGTLYGALDRLVSEGLVSESGRERVEGRERLYYALTDQGTAVLADEAERMAAASHAVNLS